MKRQPDHAKKSKDILKACNDETFVNEAREVLFSELRKSASRLITLQNSADERVALDSVKLHLALAGIAPVDKKALDLTSNGKVICFLPEQDGGQNA